MLSYVDFSDELSVLLLTHTNGMKDYEYRTPTVLDL